MTAVAIPQGYASSHGDDAFEPGHQAPSPVRSHLQLEGGLLLVDDARLPGGGGLLVLVASERFTGPDARASANDRELSPRCNHSK